MTYHIFGSGTRFPLPEPPIPLCDWDFDNDRFPFGGGHNPTPLIPQYYMVGMPNRLVTGVIAHPTFRFFQIYVTVSTEQTWPLNTFTHLEGIVLPASAIQLTPEDFPLWIPTIVQWEDLNGGPGTGNVLFNLWTRGYCGGIHPAPNDVNDPLSHDNGDYGTANLYLSADPAPEQRDASITVTAKVNGVAVGAGEAYAVLAWGAIDLGGVNLAANYFDPMNERALTRADGTVALENITRISEWDVAVIYPGYDDMVLTSAIDCTAGGNIDIEADLIVP